MPTSHKEWCVRAFAGDAQAALLLPHQILVAHDDTWQQGLEPLVSLIVAPATQSIRKPVVALECVWSRQLMPGTVQLPAWALDTLHVCEGSAVFISVAESTASYHSLEVRILNKYPPTLAHGDAVLPECVRSGAVDLEGALLRQLRARGGATTAGFKRGMVITAQLLLETYVFSVERIESGDAPAATSDAAPALLTHVRVCGWGKQDVHNDTDVTDAPTLARRLEATGLAGYDAFVRDVLLRIALVTKADKNSDHHLQISSHGLLLTGVAGVGKSLVLRALECEVKRIGLLVKRIDALALLMEAESSRLASPYEFLVHHVQAAFPAFAAESLMQRASMDGTPVRVATGVLLLDNVDVLFQTSSGAPSDESDAADVVSPLGSSLLRLLDTMSESSRMCVVGTATTGAGETIPSAAKRSGRFSKTIEIAVPTESMRTSILTHHLRRLPLVEVPAAAAEGPEGPEVPVLSMAARLAALTGGYVAKDLVRICRSALVQAHRAAETKSATPATGVRVTWEDLVAAQQLVKPSQLRELNVASPGAATQSDDAASAFAGYAALQRQLVDFITWKFRPTAAMHRLGVADASGILVHGPSGCGKSLLVRTLAARAAVNFVSVKSSELMSKYFGDSEKAVRQLFARARAASPCILFFDEFDAIAHKRSFSGDGGDGGGESVYARILSTFLNEMDGVGTSSSSSTSSPADSKGEILVIAATNRSDALDAALVRPGRIDKSVELGLPDAADREAILALYTRKMPLAADVSISALATRSNSGRPFTGADLSAVCKDAAFCALREDADAASVSMRHFDTAWRCRVASPSGVSTA